MSVNLNILANKALRPFALVPDIESSMQVYTSGSFYVLDAINNVPRPFTGIPQKASYCDFVFLQWSPDPTFQTAVTESIVACNSGSLSGSLLYPKSFTDSLQPVTQPGGFLGANFGYETKVFDYSLTYDDVNKGIGKQYYFRSKKIGDFASGSVASSSLEGNWSDVSNPTQIMRPNIGSVLNRTYNFLQADGFNDVTNVWQGGLPPLFVSGASPGIGGIGNIDSYSFTQSFTTGSALPEIVKYGNGSSDALKTNGMKFNFPSFDLVADEEPKGNNFVIAVIQGKVSITTETGIFSLDIDCTTNSGSLNNYGNYSVGPPFPIRFNGVRNACIAIGDRRSSGIAPNYTHFVNVSGQQGTVSPAEVRCIDNIAQQSGLLLVSTSNDCVLRYIGNETYFPNQYLGGMAGYYYANYGDTTASLWGPEHFPYNSTNPSIVSNPMVSLWSGFGFPSSASRKDIAQWEIQNDGWYDTTIKESKFSKGTGSVAITTGSKGIVFTNNSNTFTIPSASVAGIQPTGSSFTIQWIGSMNSSSTDLYSNIVFSGDDASAYVYYTTTSSAVLGVSLYESLFDLTYPIEFITGSTQVFTIMQSGSQVRAFQNYNELLNEQGFSEPTTFPLFDNINTGDKTLYIGSFTGSLAAFNLYSRSLSTTEFISPVNTYLSGNVQPYTGSISSSTILPIPSSSVLQIWKGFGNRTVNSTLYLSGANNIWYDNNSVLSKQTQTTGSIFGGVKGVQFDSTLSTISITSASLAGMSGSDYTIQFAGTLPSQSGKPFQSLLAFNNSNTQTYLGDAIVRYNLNPYWAALELRQGSTSDFRRYYITKDTGSTADVQRQQLITIKNQSGVMKVYQGFNEVTASSQSTLSTSSIWPVFNSLSVGKVFFGWNGDVDSDSNYNGQLSSLLVYSRSLSDAELTSSFNAFTCSNLPLVPINVNVITSSVTLPIPSASVIALDSTFGYPAGDYSGSNPATSPYLGWWDSNPSCSKFIAMSTGSLTASANGLGFGGNGNSLQFLSQSIAGMRNKSEFTFQFALTTPEIGSYMLIGNPSIDQTFPGVGDDARLEVTPTTSSLVLNRSSDGGVGYWKYDWNTNTSSLHLLTLNVVSASQYTGVPSFWYNLTPTTASALGANPRGWQYFEVMGDPNRINDLRFGWGDGQTGDYKGNVKGLLLYSRSLNDTEISASYNYYISGTL